LVVMINGMRRAAARAIVALALAPAVVRADDPQLSVVSASGLRGGTVAVVIRLANDATNSAFTADVDIAFPTDLLEFFPPVRTTCTIAPRLAATHQVAGRVPEPGRVVLSILARGGMNSPLGDGDLASCAFHILADALSSPAALSLQSPLLGDSNGLVLPVSVADGAIFITDAPNQPTPTVVPACAADCNGDGEVLVNEVILGVNIALDNRPLSACPAADRDGDGVVVIGEIILAVNNVISGC
jgi:hypothetical protein